MTMVSGLERPSLKSRAAPILRGSAFVALCSILMSQCSMMQRINLAVAQLERQPVSVTVGKNSFAEISEPLTAEQNAQEFLREVLPLSQTLSNKLPKEMDPKCSAKPECSEAQDKGVKVNGVEVPTLVGIASNAIVPSYRRQHLVSLLENAQQITGRPVNWKSGEVLAYQIFTITPKENQTYLVEGGYYHYSSKGEPIAAYSHDTMIKLKSILPPKPNSNTISVQKAISIALSRGYLVEFVEVIR